MEELDTSTRLTLNKEKQRLEGQLAGIPETERALYYTGRELSTSTGTQHRPGRSNDIIFILLFINFITFSK